MPDENKELIPGMDGGISVDDYIKSQIDAANNPATGKTFVVDFFRSPDVFFVDNQSLMDYLSQQQYILDANTNQWKKDDSIVNDESKKEIFKEFVKSKNPNIDENVLVNFVKQWNQHFLYASNLLPYRLPFIASSPFMDEQNNMLAAFDANGEFTVHLTTKQDQIAIQIKKKLGYKIPAGGALRSFSDCTQTLIFKNVAAAGEVPRYEVSRQATEYSNLKVKALLEKPYANREYRLQRELLCEMRKPIGQDDPEFDAMLLQFDENVINAVRENQDCSHMDLTGVNLSGLDLSNKNFDHKAFDHKAIDVNTKLIGIKVSHNDLAPAIIVNYMGVDLQDPTEVFQNIIGPVRQTFHKAEKSAPVIRNLFELLSYIQEHPNDKFSKEANRELFIYLIKKTENAKVLEQLLIHADQLGIDILTIQDQMKIDLFDVTEFEGIQLKDIKKTELLKQYTGCLELTDDQEKTAWKKLLMDMHRNPLVREWVKTVVSPTPEAEQIETSSARLTQHSLTSRAFSAANQDHRPSAEPAASSAASLDDVSSTATLKFSAKSAQGAEENKTPSLHETDENKLPSQEKAASPSLSYDVTKKQLPKNPTPKEIIAHHLKLIACLKAEYEDRKSPEKQYHWGFFKFAQHTASDKLNAVKAFEKELRDNQGMLDEITLKENKILMQGRLGKSVKAILQAQKELGVQPPDIREDRFSRARVVLIEEDNASISRRVSAISIPEEKDKESPKRDFSGVVGLRHSEKTLKDFLNQIISRYQKSKPALLPGKQEVFFERLQQAVGIKFPDNKDECDQASFVLETLLPETSKQIDQLMQTQNIPDDQKFEIKLSSLKRIFSEEIKSMEKQYPDMFSSFKNAAKTVPDFLSVLGDLEFLQSKQTESQDDLKPNGSFKSLPT